MSLSLASVLTAAAEETHRELPMPPTAYGILALVAFGLLLGVLWTFRGTAQKVRSPQSGHGGSGHGASGHGH